LLKTWKFLYSGEGDPFFNLALDEILFFENQKRDSVPVLRIYGWDRPAISIGYFQNVNRACNLAECQKQNLPVIRRITGGRAVFHGKDLTYSLVGSSERYPELGQNVLETYHKTSQAFLQGLKMLGIECGWEKGKKSENGKKSTWPCFASTSIYEVTHLGKKLIGSAQKRVGSRFIQQGSLPLSSVTAAQKIFLGNGENANNGFDKKFTSLSEALSQKINLPEVARVLKSAWEKFWKIELVEMELTPRLIQQTQELRDRKYSQGEWNYLK